MPEILWITCDPLPRLRNAFSRNRSARPEPDRGPDSALRSDPGADFHAAWLVNHLRSATALAKRFQPKPIRKIATRPTARSGPSPGSEVKRCPFADPDCVKPHPDTQGRCRPSAPGRGKPGRMDV